MIDKFKVGDLLYNVRCSDEMHKRQQHITIYIDGGYFDEDDAVRAINGTLVDFFEEGLFFASKNDAINEAIRKLVDMKE
jgi:pentose-5-phosphate-3-epimerase